MNRNYIYLFLTGTIFMVISFGLNKTWQWASDAFSNIATGFFGSIVIYYLIERSLESSRERETIERRKIAFTRVRPPLGDLLRFLWQLYKASCIKPEVLPASYHELFNDEYYNNIRYLDFEQDAPVVPKRTWMIYSPQVINRIKSQLEAVIESYGLVFNPETLELLEQILHCHIFYFFDTFPAIIQIDKQEGFKRSYLMLNGGHELLREDVLKIMLLLDKVNAIIEHPLELSQDFFRDDVSPRWGANRTKLII